jgi:hypothetical protein
LGILEHAEWEWRPAIVVLTNTITILITILIAIQHFTKTFHKNISHYLLPQLSGCPCLADGCSAKIFQINYPPQLSGCPLPDSCTSLSLLLISLITAALILGAIAIVVGSNNEYDYLFDKYGIDDRDMRNANNG